MAIVCTAAENDSMNALAERYVKLVLALGQHDADYVDAYYGPPEWQKEAERAKRPLADIDRDAAGAGSGARRGNACGSRPRRSSAPAPVPVRAAGGAARTRVDAGRHRR